MLLGVGEVVGREAGRVDVLEDYARVGGDGRQQGCVVEVEVAPAVLRGDRAIDPQQAGQLVGGESGQLEGCLFGLRTERGLGCRGQGDVARRGHGLGAGDEDLHAWDRSTEFGARPLRPGRGVFGDRDPLGWVWPRICGAYATGQGIPSASTRAAIACSSSRGTFSSVGQGVSRSSE